jgi:hypothetical protein
MPGFRLTALLLTLIALPWAIGRPSAHAQDLQSAAGPESRPVFDQPESARAAPASGRVSSLGGSGATGPDSVGTLPERDTGFDRKTWRDTPFPLVLRLIDALPGRIDSAAEHMLARNLLVSVGDAPPGDDGGSRMLERRVVKLLALGNVDDAAALARSAPGLPDNAALAHAEIEAELLADQVEAACIDLRAFSGILTDPASADALVLCRERAGETVPGDIPPLDVDQLGAAARIAGAALPANADAPPARLVAASRDGKLPPEQRLESAYGAARASAILGEDLAAIFRATPTAGNIGDGGPPTDGAGAAALFKAIDAEGDTHKKVALAERGLLSPVGICDKISPAMAEPLRNLQPVDELAVLATRFAIIFYTLGDFDAAAPWADLADRAGSGAALWPYRVILKDSDPAGIGEWQQQSGLDAPHNARIMAILSAFAVTAPPRRRASVAGDDRPEPDLQPLLAMDAAAKESRVGETTLRAIALLGRDGPAHAHPLTLRRVLADLDAAHMHNEAHALAFEAITATLFGH